ncbi:MAG TPA: PHB depolymerase family esterase [Candidatus Saccharimonadales bacterium]
MLSEKSKAIALSDLLISQRGRGSLRTMLYRKRNANHNNQRRYYRLYKPRSKRKLPLIIGLHGLGDTALRFAYYTGLHNVVGRRAAVLYPEATKPTNPGVKRGWNAKFCCGSGWLNNIDDAGFIWSLVDKLADEGKIDKRRVFVTGFSNGGFFAQRLAAEYPKKIKKAAVVAGTIGTAKTRLRPKSAVPILLIHGKQDKTVLFKGGINSNDPDFDWLPFKDTVAAWQAINGQSAEVKTVEFDNAGHAWPGWRLGQTWRRKPLASKLIIDFFLN